MKQSKVDSISIENINDGAVTELFEEEWLKVIRNIADLNTKPDAIREITIKVKIKPDKTRRTAVSTIMVESKLPPLKPHESFVFFEKTQDGLTAYPDDPRQPTLDGIEEGQQEGTESKLREFPRTGTQA